MRGRSVFIGQNKFLQTADLIRIIRKVIRNVNIKLFFRLPNAIWLQLVATDSHTPVMGKREPGWMLHTLILRKSYRVWKNTEMK